MVNIDPVDAGYAYARRLRSENDGLRAELEARRMLNDALRAENTRLRAALEAVEWHTEEDDWQVCAWCHAGGWGNQKHEPNCQRQEALKEEG